MTVLPNTPPGAILGGRLQSDYIIPLRGKARLNILGGNLAYAAAAYALWGGQAGLLARVPNDFPVNWLDLFDAKGFDLRGVVRVADAIYTRRFFAYSETAQVKRDNPIECFYERRLPFPKELIGFDGTQDYYSSKNQFQGYSIHISDVPRSYLDATAAHICPIDYLSHKLLPSLLKSGTVQTVSMRACSGYMEPSYWEEMRGLISDLTAFMFTDTEGLRLFQGRSVDLWEIAEQLGSYGPEFIIVSMSDGATWLYDRLKQNRWIIPAYPAVTNDPTGALDVFDGAFLINYRKNFDALEAALCGCISTSITVEGSGPYYLWDTLPGLKEARMEVLRQQVKSV